MKALTWIPLMALAVLACGGSPGAVAGDGDADDEETSLATTGSAQMVADVESALRQFYVYLTEFDHAAIRETTTQDFEFLSTGRRMDGGAFEAFIRGMESGGTILGFTLSDLNTEAEPVNDNGTLYGIN